MSRTMRCGARSRPRIIRRPLRIWVPSRDKPNGRRPAVIICGGGGFTHIAPHEQDPVAFAFLDRGYQAFVLNYVTSSTGDVSFPHPQADLAKMVATVRANADEWHVDPKRVCVVGFSAGGMICASLATQWKTGPFAALAGARPDDIRPDAVVLGYPLLDFAYVRDMQTRDPRIDLRVPKTGGKTGRDLLNDYLSMVTGGEATDEHLADICPTTHVSRQMPPTFVWGVSDDKTAPIAQVYPFAQRMAEEGMRDARLRPGWSRPFARQRQHRGRQRGQAGGSPSLDPPGLPLSGAPSVRGRASQPFNNLR